MPGPYRKHFLPLESNPEVFNELLHRLGASPELTFQDVFTLDEPNFLPRPALAVILVLPTTETYEARKTALESSRPDYNGSGDGEPVVWFRQTINNACGLYALLHALSNGPASKFIESGCILARLLQTCIPCGPEQRSGALENSLELEQAHAAVAAKGDSLVPDNAEDDVDFHYICFVRSNVDGHLYELDGDCKGPIDTGIALSAEEDVLSPQALGLIRGYVEQEEESIGFNVMALVHTAGIS
ncbi:ubiquitin carboxyl-terminal hydrolase, family 1 [Lasiosphaeria ovina]|uniref:Ubiquitin carboxyl-terminal hydrolase n=1 Tax=Lasiosphaeria ovina TaxID=92902 RepID=A0AAE0K3J2_9PEZI|nr:ubiquitin carboxyl-terminal hydrolase, family 1 [Lasiosphaeria ovina]